MKPIIDLSWNTRFGVVLGQDLNLQTIVAIAVLGTAVLTLVTHRSSRTRLEQAALVLAGVALCACLVSASLRGVGDLLRLLSSLAAIVVAPVALSSRGRLDLFLRVFVAATTVPLVLALLQTVGVLSYQRVEWQDDAFVGRASGLYEHPINLAVFLLMAIPAALYLIAAGAGRTEKALHATFIISALAALFLTTHRASLLAGAVVVLGWLLLSGKRRLILLSLVVMALTAVLLWEKVTDLIAAGFGGSSFLRGRGDIWSAFMESWLDGGPLTWVLGDGYAYAESDVPLLGAMYSTEPHNDFLRMLVTYGFIGLVCHLAVFVTLLVPAIRLLRRGEIHDVLLGRIVLLGSMAILIVSLTAEPFRYPSNVWVLLALGACAALRDSAGRAGLASQPREGTPNALAEIDSASTARPEGG